MPDFGLFVARSSQRDHVYFLKLFHLFSYCVRIPDATDNTQPTSSVGRVLSQLATTLYTPAARQQSRKQHHACAAVFPRCSAVVSD